MTQHVETGSLAHVLFRFLVLLWCLAIGGSIAAHQYSLCGTLAEVSATREGTLGRPIKYQFRVSVNGARWMMICRDTEGILDTMIISHDGTNRYQYHSSRKGLTSGAVFTARTSYPDDLPELQSTLWLATASGAFLDTHAGNSLPAVFPNSFAVRDCFTSSVARFDLPPRLPATVRFDSVKDCIRKAAAEQELRGRNSEAEFIRQFYGLDSVRGLYSVASSTNYAGLELPLAFRLEEWCLEGDQEWRKTEFIGHITNVGPCEVEVFVPGLTGTNTWIVDTRNPHYNALYIATNSIWLSRQSAFSIGRKVLKENHREPANLVTWLALALVLSVAFHPALLLLRKQCSSRGSRLGERASRQA